LFVVKCFLKPKLGISRGMFANVQFWGLFPLAKIFAAERHTRSWACLFKFTTGADGACGFAAAAPLA
jgi:hypothetical protein